jgi:hypothetical protein
MGMPVWEEAETQFSPVWGFAIEAITRATNSQRPGALRGPVSSQPRMTTVLNEDARRRKRVHVTKWLTAAGLATEFAWLISAGHPDNSDLHSSHSPDVPKFPPSFSYASWYGRDHQPLICRGLKWFLQGHRPGSGVLSYPQSPSSHWLPYLHGLFNKYFKVCILGTILRTPVSIIPFNPHNPFLR